MNREVVVAIHQPNYLPWLGFFDKARQADIFVVLDNVQYARRSWGNRVRIKTAQGAAWLSVPVKVKGRRHQSIAEVEIEYGEDWVDKHLTTLERNYRPCPFYAEMERVVQEVLSRRPSLLETLNVELIQSLFQVLGIQTKLAFGKDLGIVGKATELLINIVRQVGGTAYLSGDGASGYQEDECYREAGIGLRFQRFQHPVYQQRFGEFIPGMSVFDALCCCGGKGARELLEDPGGG